MVIVLYLEGYLLLIEVRSYLSGLLVLTNFSLLEDILFLSK